MNLLTNKNMRAMGADPAQYTPDDAAALYAYFDIDYLKSLTRNVTDFLDCYYFRSEFIGFDRLDERPDPGVPLVYASNQSGMAFPWDALILSTMLFKRHNYEHGRALRLLGDAAFSESRYTEPFLISNLWRRVGALKLDTPGLQAALANRENNVLAYPEGMAGKRKGFGERYQLAAPDEAFIRAALRRKADIIPIHTVNAEYLHPFGTRVQLISDLAERLNLPFVPTGPLSAFMPFAPWTLYLGLPAKLTFVKGTRLRLHEQTDQTADNIRPDELARLGRWFQEQVQTELTDAVASFGNDPYRLEELADLWRDNLDRILYALPSGWPLLFAEHERLYRRNMAGFMVHDNAAYMQAMLRNPELLALLVPVAGWSLLSALRR